MGSLIKVSSFSPGSTKCKLCGYLEYSAQGSSSCQQCTTTSQNNADNVCPLNPYSGGQITNLVSETFGSREVRSFERDLSGDYELSGTVDVPLVSENKPFYIHSVVLVSEVRHESII
jgi:hypothetical protein